MRCPACGHENITGVDECARCAAALMQEDVPHPTTPVTRSLMSDAIARLQPPAAECVPSGTSVAAAIGRMQSVNKGYVCVTHADGTLAGIFTERAVLALAAAGTTNLAAIPVDRVMTAQATALRLSVPIAHGVHIMAVHGFRHVPIVDDAGRPSGILSSRRILEYIQEIA